MREENGRGSEHVDGTQIQMMYKHVAQDGF